ncbi:MAG: extracellular solute-binding protein, partial [Actinomycetaceae bacterium]|nr:extracellular solute-binding protein [Actinomycetaceae bacterium]
IEAAAYLKDLMDNEILSSSSTGANVESTRKSFQSGDVAFIIESEAKASLWDEAGIDYGHIVSLSHKQEGTFFASDQLVMFNACSDKQMCYNFMDYLTQGEQMVKFHERSPYEPVGQDETVAEPSEFTTIYTEHKDILHSLPIVPNSVGAYQVLYKNLQAMLTGQKTPEQAMTDAAEEANRALAQ